MQRQIRLEGQEQDHRDRLLTVIVSPPAAAVAGIEMEEEDDMSDKRRGQTRTKRLGGEIRGKVRLCYCQETR